MWLGPVVPGRNGGDPGTMSRSRYCFLFFGSSFPYLPLRSAQVKLRSLPSGSVTFPRTSLKTQPPLAFDSPVGLPEICLQLIWFPTVVFPAASNLGHLTFLASRDISYLLHPSTLHVETSTYCSCPQEQEASRQLGADLSLTNNDTLPLHIGMATQCWSEHGWLNHYLTISDRHRVKARWLLAWPFLNHASCIGWKGGQGRQLLCSFLPLTSSPVRQWQALIFLLLIPKNFFQCSRFWSNDGGIAVGEQGEDQKHIGLILPNSFSIGYDTCNESSLHSFLAPNCLCNASPLVFALTSTDLSCLRIKYFAKVEERAFLKLCI